jgi:hypothetical protein
MNARCQVSEQHLNPHKPESESPRMKKQYVQRENEKSFQLYARRLFRQIYLSRSRTVRTHIFAEDRPTCSFAVSHAQTRHFPYACLAQLLKTFKTRNFQRRELKDMPSSEQLPCYNSTCHSPSQCCSDKENMDFRQ